MENLPPQNNDQNIPEEEPIPNQAPATPVMFDHQWKIGGKSKYNNVLLGRGSKKEGSTEIEASANYSDMMRLIEGLSKQVEELTLQYSRDNPYVMARDATMDAQEDDDDDADAAKDPQPLEFCGSPCDL
ncbi:hypothetical protein Tco_0573599 [Tanacetum coccineum]